MYLIPSDVLLSSAEVELLKAYAASGHGIVVTGNAINIPGYTKQQVFNLPVNQLLAPFGMQMLDQALTKNVSATR